MNNKIPCRNCQSKKETIKIIKSEITIKGKKITIEGNRRVCLECGQLKFDKVLDQKYSEQAIKIYNKRYGIRGKQIKELRKEFGVSQETFGKVLGISKKTIVSYENETAIPNDSYYTLIKSIIEDKSKFIDFANINRDSLTAFEIKKVFDNNQNLVYDLKDPFVSLIAEEPTEYNGYRYGSKNCVESIIQYISSILNGKTKLAKTMFFADALAYSETAETITGIPYVAATNGPLPQDFDKILCYMIDKDQIHLKIEEVEDYTYYNYYPNVEVDLSDPVKKYVDRAIEFTKNKTAAKLSEITHKMNIWLETDPWKPMSFDKLYDFNLDNIT